MRGNDGRCFGNRPSRSRLVWRLLATRRVAGAALRLAVLTVKETGDWREALRMAIDYRVRVGEDAVLDRQIAVKRRSHYA